MTTTLIAVDTGATNTRLAVGDAAGAFEAAARSERKINTASALLEFIADAVDALPEGNSILLAGGFAGPRDGREINMTNWGGGDRLTVNMFTELGIARCRILNDLEAAASGLLHLLAARVCG